jgi:Phasin protein
MTTQTSKTDPTATQNAMLAWPIEAFQNATTTCLSAIENSSGMQTEWQHFIQQRLEKDGNYPGKLMTCKTPADFLQAQFDFVNDFFVDYTKEFQRMGEMMREAGDDSLKAVHKNGAGPNSPVA